MLNKFANLAATSIPTNQHSNTFFEVLIFLAVCLASTIIIEILFAIVFKVRKRDLLIVLLAQIVTNPLVVLVSNLIYYASGAKMEWFLTGLAIMEPLAFIVEGVMYKHFFENYKFLKPFLLSFLLNFLSLIFGTIIIVIITFLNVL